MPDCIRHNAFKSWRTFEMILDKPLDHSVFERSILVEKHWLCHIIGSVQEGLEDGLHGFMLSFGVRRMTGHAVPVLCFGAEPEQHMARIRPPLGILVEHLRP